MDVNLKRVSAKKRYPIILENYLVDYNMDRIIEYIHEALKDNATTIFIDKLDQYCKNWWKWYQ